MSADPPQKKENDAFDVVFMHGPTADGEGARVLRARPNRIEAGEVRPLREGRPMTGGGEVVRLERRGDAPSLFDVRVEFALPAAPTPPSLPTNPEQTGPAQVATRAYREAWDRTFGVRRDGPPN